MPELLFYVNLINKYLLITNFMKKILYFASAAALLTASCSDDFSPNSSQKQILEGKSQVNAVMPIGDPQTRTYVEGNGKTYPYYWAIGDALGVIAEDNSIYNAMYAYAMSEPSTQGTFVSQVEIESTGIYYGYYPYDPSLEFTAATDGVGPKVTLPIQAQQTFNNNNGNIQQTNFGGQAVGSFANGMAPAVAVSSEVADNQIDFSFVPQAGYIVVPVTGNSVVTSVSISLSSPEPGQDSYIDYAQLNGSLVVDLINNEVAVGVQPVETTGTSSSRGQGYYNVSTSTTPDFASNPNYLTTVNCGKGVQLDLTTPTNFWFVVPADLELSGWTLNLYFNGDTETVADSRTFGTLNNGNTVGRNNVRYFWKSVDATDSNSNKPFQYNPTGAYYITEPYQFLEYAYLVTNANKEGYQSSWNSLDNKSYTDLQNMLKPEAFSTDEETGEVTLVNTISSDMLRPAIITQNLSDFVKSVSEYIGYMGTGYWSGDLPEYYQNIYGEFRQNQAGDLKLSQAIPTIGGALQYNISGLVSGTTTTSISGLNITSAQGNGQGGMFIGDPSVTTSTSLVSNLTLTNINVLETVANTADDNNGEYFFLAWPNFVTFSNVTVGTGCAIKGDTGVTISEDAEMALFMAYNGSDYGVNNNSGLTFAINFLVSQAGYDFTAPGAIGLDDFYHISLTGPDSGALITLPDTMNVNQIGEFIDRVVTNNLGYSVVADETSYWTGTAYDTDNYAEGLAYAVQNKLTSYTVSMPLNLMGSYSYMKDNETVNGSQYWWANNDTNITITGGTASAPVSITNVFINGTDGTSTVKTRRLNIFGLSATVGYVDISDITIDASNYVVTNNNTPLIAAIAQYPIVNGNQSYVNVDGMTVITKQGYQVPNTNVLVGGGLYTTLSQNTLGLIENCSISSINVENTEGVKFGYIAGTMNFTVTGATATVKNPIILPANSNVTLPSFGYMALTVTPEEGQNTVITMQGFTTLTETDWQNLNINVTTSVGSSYTVYVYNGTTYYAYTYKNGKMSYYNQSNNAPY